MIFVRWLKAHSRSVVFLLIIASIAGIFAALGLPVALFPEVHFPRIVVSVDAGDQPVERMVYEVTAHMEESLRAVPGVRSLRSVTSRGSAEFSVNFEWGHDMDAGLSQIQAAVARAAPELPTGTTYDIRQMDPTVFPVIAYTLTSPHRSLVELRDLAQYTLRPSLASILGVAHVDVLGGEQEEFRVTADIGKLSALGMTLTDLTTALKSSNMLEAVGRLDENNKLYLVISNSKLEDLSQVGETVVRVSAGQIVRIKDIASVSRQKVPQTSLVTADGRQAVIFQINQQPGGNTVQIAHDIKAKLEELKHLIPDDVQVADWYDQSELIISSAKSVREAVLIGVGLAVIVLFIFLRNIKVTLIAAITVPAVLASTTLLLSVFGMSFNIMTLGGMAAAVGLIIDDVIVMIEHIIRRLRERGSADHSVLHAAWEFLPPLTGSSAATIVIFAPLAFLTGVHGAFFKALSITIASGLIISYLIAALVVPALASRLLQDVTDHDEGNGFFTRFFHRLYRMIMRPLLAWPILVLIPAAALIFGSYVAYGRIGTGFIPSMDEGGFILDYKAPPGTSLAETNRLLQQLEAIILETPEVKTYSRRTGLQLGGGLSESNEGDFFIRLKPQPRRDIDEIMDEIRGKVVHAVPGLDIEMALLMEDLIGDLTAVPQPIEIKLFSDDGKVLSDLAPKVAEALGKINGVVDISDGLLYAGDAVDITVDREKAALDGLTAESVTDAINEYLSGTVATQIQQGQKLIGVRTWIPSSDRRLIRDIGLLNIHATDGHLVPVSRVATLTTVSGQPQIMHEDLKRLVAVTGRISGRDLGSTVNDVKAMMNQPDMLPKGVYYSLGGLYEQQQIAFKGLTQVMLAAVLLVFMLLLFLYERFRVALAMMAVALLALATVMIGLWITHTDLNISAMMGMTMVVGIVTEVTIFYSSELSEISSDLDTRTRLLEAGINRMRPITMTTVATILALFPLALGLGEGAGMQKPLAIAIISGLIVQLPLVLCVLPALLMLLRAGSSKHAQTQPSAL